MAKKLTALQRAFILEFPKDFNATRAAKRAGYSKKTAKQIGYENLTKPYLWERIEAEFKKRSTGLDEVIFRLSDQATASIGDFLSIVTEDQIGLDPEEIKNRGHLVKRLNVRKKTSFTKDGDPIIETHIIIELHDGQRALELLGKYHQAFVDRMRHEGDEDRPVAIILDR
jgi:phage terminase small subunit